MIEKEIEKILVSEVKKLGGRAHKWVSPGNDGVPDRIVIFSGRPAIFVELKSDTGKLSALQQIQIQRLQDLGQAVFVVKGITGLSQFFHGLGYSDTSRALDKKYGL
ncbi:MAG: VRR-NUC domain-containing protein [Lachnospiraceae bacterium]|nr:VRR-NUC domain-containing protein [Lachnospiraceae bacterium]